MSPACRARVSSARTLSPFTSGITRLTAAMTSLGKRNMSGGDELVNGVADRGRPQVIADRSNTSHAIGSAGIAGVIGSVDSTPLVRGLDRIVGEIEPNLAVDIPLPSLQLLL
jgi:hypothetical protein